MKRFALSATIIAMILVALTASGCQDSKQTKMYMMENGKLKQQLDDANAEIETQKALVTKAEAEKAEFEKKSNAVIKGTMDMIAGELGTVEEIEKENQALKKQVEEQKAAIEKLKQEKAKAITDSRAAMQIAIDMAMKENELLKDNIKKLEAELAAKETDVLNR